MAIYLYDVLHAVHQQVRACATLFNAYTSHAGKCTHCSCHNKVESSKHAIAQCPRYADARAGFQRRTGLTFCDATYVDIMALNYKKLNAAAGTLAKVLCTLLANIAKAHMRHNRTDNSIASVANPLGCNQRRSIILATQSERAPDYM